MDLYKELKERIIPGYEKKGSLRLAKKGATSEQITAFEQKHGITLPTQYKDWLRYADGGEFFLPAGVQLYGVAHEPVIDVADNDRPDDAYLVIGALASGDPILCKKSGEQICIYNHSAGRIEEDEIYPNFSAFIEGMPELLGVGG